MNYNIHDIRVHLGVHVHVFSGQNVIHQLMMDHNGVNSVTKLSCQTKLLSLLNIQVVSQHQILTKRLYAKKNQQPVIMHFIYI